MSTTTPQTTSLISGRYRKHGVIGRGGMSTVYRATDTILGREVAVKVLLAALAERDPSYIARFQREARAAASLRHPAVVKIYDTGTDDGSHYIVMEYVPGQSLDEVIRERPLRHREAARIASQVAEAVAAAHAAGVLHRDIKPANVILKPDGAIKVLDFGVARTVQETTITNPAFAVGTVSYMAPERVLGHPGDERTDIYGIGCLLYALLTGRPPFLAEESIAILSQQVHAEAVPPSEAGAAVSPGLDRLVMRMLAKDPADRPQSAAEVAGLLAASTGEAEPTLVAPTSRGRSLASTGEAEPTLVAPTPRGRSLASPAVPLDDADRRRRGVPVAALVLAAAVILIVLVVALGGGGAKPAGGASGSVRRVGARLGRAGVQATSARLASLRGATKPASASTPAPTVQSSSPAATPVPPGQARKSGLSVPAKKAKPPKPPKPPKPAKHIPPGHGGAPPGQAKKGHG